MKNSVLCEIGHFKYKIMLRLNEGILAKRRYGQLKKKKFTIISNNCWGGYVYRCFNSPYQSPTVGLFIMPDDYIKFVKRLSYYIKDCKMVFIKAEQSKYYNYLSSHDGFGKYPIGLLGDIEIFFVHYKTKEEALQKWERRCKRINWDNLIIKFCDQNGCSEKQIKDFNDIKKYKKMICFTANKHEGHYNVRMWEFGRDGFVVDDKYYLFQHVNLKRLIEGDS